MSTIQPVTASAAILAYQAKHTIAPEVILDTAAGILANLAALGPLITAGVVASFTLTGTNTVTAAQLTSLAALNNFGLQSGATITATGAATDLLANTAAITRWSSLTQLTGSNVVSNAQAIALVKLHAFSIAAGSSFVVDDTAANLLAGRATWGSKAAGIIIAGANIVTAYQATLLAGAGSFAIAALASFVVSDSATNLLNASYAPGLAKATATVLTGSNTVNLARATALAALPSLSLAAGAVLIVADTAAALAAASPSFAFSPVYNIVGDSVVSTAQAAALVNIGAIRTTGNVKIEDGAAALLTAAPAVLALATYTLIIGSNTVTAAQATALAALTRFGGVPGSSLTVQDSAAAVLANVAAVGRYASNTVLTGENTITAANFVTLNQVYAITWNTTDPRGLLLQDTYTNFVAAQAALAGMVIPPNYGPILANVSLILAGAPVTAAAGLQAAANVVSFTVSDTGAHLSGSALIAFEWDSKLTAITVTDHGALAMSYSQYVGLTHVVSLIGGAFSIVLTGVPVADAAAIQANPLVSGFSVTDSFGNISSNYAAIQAYPKLTGVDPTYDAAYSPAAIPFYAQFNPASLSLNTVPVAAVASAATLASVAGFTIADTAQNFTGQTAAFAQLSQVTAIDVTGSGGQTNLDLTGTVFPATIDMGANTATVSAGLGTQPPVIAFTPDTITLGSGPSTVDYALQPSSGIEVITNFTYGLDTLDINLEGASSGVLEAFDTTLNGSAAIAITSSADPTHGVILAGVSTAMTATNLLGDHVTTVGAHTLIS